MSDSTAAAAAGGDADHHTARLQLEASVAQQGNIVRELKKSKAPKEEIQAAVAELLRRKEELAKQALPESAETFNKQSFEELMRRRFFYAPSFEIYGGVAGLYDYGPTGCAIMANLVAEWRQHFVTTENMFEVNCTAMTPHFVLDASGHTARFSDIMVRDLKTGDCLRADHLLEDVMEKMSKDPKNSAELQAECKRIHTLADSYSKEELSELFERFNIKAPATGNDLSPPVDFNMMFQTSIGPTGDLTGFLRPETAQGMFLSFKRLYEFNNFRLPFAAAQIGTAFRNEISPKAGLLRVREFQMAEVEHFVDPLKKDHPKFAQVADLVLPLYRSDDQRDGKPYTSMSLRDAVANGVVCNETIAYFLGRIYLFMVNIGIDKSRIRFRQHLPTEMAHYAQDCWDCELQTSYGWIECVGCADRSCYDLEQHAKASKVPLFASEPLKEPIITDEIVIKTNKGVVGKTFKKEAAVVFERLETMTLEEKAEFEEKIKEGPVTITADGKEYEIAPNMVAKVVHQQRKDFERKFLPHVVEPSFGLGRIIYALLEHNLQVREGDEQRQWLSLPPIMAPVKASLLPLSNNAEFDPFLDEIEVALAKAGVSVRREDSGASIGRRYARTDEIGIPFGVTVDFDTKENRSVTVRERNSMKQIRVPIDELPQLLVALSNGTKEWKDACSEFPETQTGSK